VKNIRDTEEIVVKPLDRHMKDLPLYAGATIMGDGHIALILDIIGLARRAHIVGEGREQELSEEHAAAAAAEAAKNLTPLLLVRVQGGKMGIPLSDVARLEEIEPERVEVVGGQSVVQYRGEIMPLIPISEVVPERRKVEREEESAGSESGSNLQVVVYSESGRSVGLVVDEVLDILDADLSLRKEASREFVLYSSVVRDQVTEILDVRRVIKSGDPRREEEFDAMTLGV
jgi:two-component system chemotaxis sensor kinase CheA